MFKRLLLSALLLASNALALPSDNNGGPLANLESFRSYVRAQKPTMFLDPDYVQSVTQDSVARVSSLATLYGSVNAFTQGTDANKPVLSRPDRVENLLLQSEDFTGSNWNFGKLTRTANTVANPIDGAVTADTITEDGTAGAHYLEVATGNIVSGIAYTYSCYVKRSAGTRSVNLYLYSGFPANSFAYFNAGTGALILAGAGLTSYSMTDAGNGWWKFSISATATSSTTTTPAYIYQTSSGTLSYTGDSTSALYLYGAQLQRSSMQPTYVATTTVPVYGSLTGRRMLTFDGSNDTMASTSLLSAIMTNAAGEFFITYTPNLINTAQHLFQSRGGYIYYRTEATGSIAKYLNYDGTSDTVSSPTIAAGTNYVAYGRHDAGNIYLALNRSATASAASGNTSNVGTVLDLGSSDGSANFFNGQLGPIITFNRVLPQPVRDTIRAGLQKFWRVG